MRRMCPTALAALLLGAVATPAPAQDAAAESPDAMAREARGHYDAGRYEQAVASYLKAYRLNPTAGFLYNVAVIYDRKLNEAELAIDFYRRYIKSEDADPAAVERASSRIKALKAEAEARKAAQPAPPPPPSAAPSNSEPLPPPPPPAERGMTSRDVAAYTMMGVGAAAVVGGAVLGGLAWKVEGEYADAETADDKRNLQALGKSEALIGDIMMVGGVALAGAGLVLLLTGGDSETQASGETSVSATPLPGGGFFFGLGSTL